MRKVSTADHITHAIRSSGSHFGPHIPPGLSHVALPGMRPRPRGVLTPAVGERRHDATRETHAVGASARNRTPVRDRPGRSGRRRCPRKCTSTGPILVSAHSIAAQAARAPGVNRRRLSGRPNAPAEGKKLVKKRCTKRRTRWGLIFASDASDSFTPKIAKSSIPPDRRSQPGPTCYPPTPAPPQRSSGHAEANRLPFFFREFS